MVLDTVLDFAHKVIRNHVKSGDAVIDATVGKGTDTMFLARLVGAKGIVFGFDIQAEAIKCAKKNLQSHLESHLEGQIQSEGNNPLLGAVQWLTQSHETMLEVIPNELIGRISAVMFNLGYFPGSDHTVVTRADSTLSALQASVHLLQKGGIITIVAYTGHIGAQEEADAVLEWAAALAQSQFHVLHYHFINQKNHPPFLIIVEKIQ